MANRATPMGFRPYGELYRVVPMMAGAAIYPGDVVKRQAGSVAGGTEVQVIASTAGAAHIGVALSYASASGVQVLVADHPEQLYIATGSGTPTNASVADLGLNANILATGGNATYKVSRMSIAANTLATTNTLDVKVLGLLRVQDSLGNSVALAGAVYICKLNNSQEANQIAGV